MPVLYSPPTGLAPAQSTPRIDDALSRTKSFILKRVPAPVARRHDRRFADEKRGGQKAPGSSYNQRYTPSGAWRGLHRGMHKGGSGAL